MMKKLSKLVLFMFIFSTVVEAHSNVTFKGYYKNFYVVFRQPNRDFSRLFSLPEQKYVGMVNKRVRLQFLYYPSDWFSFETAYDISSRIQDPALFSQNLFLEAVDPMGYRFDDIETQLYPEKNNTGGNLGVFQNLDRFFFTLSLPAADIFLGRQSIAWGNARVINPVNVIAPFVFNELDKEERTGVDAVRIRVPIGFMGEIDAGYVMGRDFDFDKSAVFLRSKFYVAGTDISALTVNFQENMLFGLDMARSIGGAGVWFEGAVVYPENDFDNRDSYFRVSAGLDYSLSEEAYGFFEYHFNGAGSCHPDAYMARFTGPAYTQGAVYLLSKHYVAPGVNYQLTPLISLNMTTLFNVCDYSIYVAPGIEYNIADNVYLSAGAYAGFGKSIRNFDIRSEFGLYPDTIFTSFNYYF